MEHLYSYFWDEEGKRLNLQRSMGFPGETRPHPLQVDFAFLVQSALKRYRQTGGGIFAKALGGKKYSHPLIVDATFGLGHDSALILSFRSESIVCAIERSPHMQVLMSETWKKYLLDGSILQERPAWEQRFHFYAGDTRQQLPLIAKEQGRLPDVIYLDPMYHQDKDKNLKAKNPKAKNKVEMRIFRELVGDDTDAPQLLTFARQWASGRVVVKRPLRAPPLGDLPPRESFVGKSTRYDVYAPILNND